jgi:hypothetical protein
VVRFGRKIHFRSGTCGAAKKTEQSIVGSTSWQSKARCSVVRRQRALRLVDLYLRQKGPAVEFGAMTTSVVIDPQLHQHDERYIDAATWAQRRLVGFV